MREIKYIVVHCADTYRNMDIGAKEIDGWHKERGWSGIGYHYVIRRDGTVEIGRPLDTPGAHAKGYNSNSIGICLVGGKPRFNFTWEQLIALRQLYADLKFKFEKAKWLGHYEITTGKTCPTFNVRDLLGE
jgi:N-acetyl-anhydromuramyl-L-alanine amidase AmpD